MTQNANTDRAETPVVVLSAELIRIADEIDNRLGPISGRTADRIAVLLRQAAGCIGQLRDALLPHAIDDAARAVAANHAPMPAHDLMARLRSVAECHPDEPFGNLLRTAANRIEPLATQSSAIVQFLKDMRASGSWDEPTLDRAIEVAEAAIAHATA